MSFYFENPAMVKFYPYISDYEVRYKKECMRLIESITEDNILQHLSERRVDIDKYINNRAHALFLEVRAAIINYNMHPEQPIPHFAKLDRGFGYIPFENDLPRVIIIQRKEHTPATYLPEYKCIAAYLLNKNFEFDSESYTILDEQLEKSFAHELGHYWDVDSAKGRGIHFKAAGQFNKKNIAPYVNNRSEKSAFTKEIELEVMNYITDPRIFTTLLFYPDEEQQKELRDAINWVIYKIKTKDKDKLGPVLNNLSNKNLHQLYRDVYEYCVEEFIKLKNSSGMPRFGSSVRSKLLNNDLYNAWVKDHKF